MSDPLILIPARMEAARLPGKPLALIAGEPMIVRVWRRACAAGLGPVVVATDSEAIAAVVRAAGGDAVMTRADHASGSDRVFEALERYDPDGEHQIVVNLQGDLPTIEPASLVAVLEPLDDSAVEIATLAAVITCEDARTNPNVVKMIGAALTPVRQRALYFTRAAAPHGAGPLFEHIGIYAYRRRALRRFVTLPPSPLELREKLEQLRAIEAGMRIDVMLVPHAPIGVDDADDLARVRASLEP